MKTMLEVIVALAIPIGILLFGRYLIDLRYREYEADLFAAVYFKNVEKRSNLEVIEIMERLRDNAGGRRARDHWFGPTWDDRIARIKRAIKFSEGD